MSPAQPLPPGFEACPDLWETDIRPALTALEAERKQALRRSAIIGGVIAVLAVALALWVLASGNGVLAIFFGVGAVILSSIIAGMQLKGVKKKAKVALLSPVMAALGYRHRESGFQPTGFDDCRRFSLLPGSDRKRFEDRIEGGDEGARFQLYEAHLEVKRKTKNSSHYVTVFRGVIGRLQHQSSALGETVFTRDLGIFDGMMAPRGMERAGMGENAFEDAFTVWTSDQVEARYLLPPNVMEHLARMETDFGGQKLRGAISDGWLYFIIETKNMFEPGSMFKPMDDPERFQDLMAELGSIRRLINALRDVRP